MASTRLWEKATILHAEYHRPPDKQTPDRFSWHYADTVALAADASAAGAVDRADLRERVVDWKRRFFGSAWARYDLARPTTFRLVPPAERQAGLRRDYAAMRDMYLAEPRTFDEILDALESLERRINGVTDGAYQSFSNCVISSASFLFWPQTSLATLTKRFVDPVDLTTFSCSIDLTRTPDECCCDGPSTYGPVHRR